MFLCILEMGPERNNFERLYREHGKRLYYVARKIVRSDEDAEDAVHNAFIKMTEKYRDSSYTELTRLSTTVVRNAAYDIARKYQKEGEIFKEDEIVDEKQDILEELIQRNEKHILIQAIMELSEEERELLYHQYVGNMQPREIAKLLNISSEEVRRKLFRCRNKLAKIIQEKENGK